MTQPDYDDDQYGDDDSQDGHVTLSRQQIRAMERDAKQTRQAQERLAQVERELAFARVGADFTERQQKALLATIDGEVNTDAIRAAAEDLGFLQPAAPPADTAAAQRIADASQGSPGDVDEDDAISRLHKADREGGKDAVLAELQRQGRTIVSSG